MNWLHLQRERKELIVLNWFKKEFNLGEDFDRLKIGYKEKTDEDKRLANRNIKTRDFLLEKVVELGKKILYRAGRSGNIEIFSR